ncbi:MAG: urea ABC transporter ATP-binding subunit UrtE [Planctomycetes bacterium]|nr:urea ABC transporter ATP-binding subunit UrtE [Planctomycetota bacterium]
MLTVENINFSYGNVQALFEVSLEVPRNTMVCLMGRNGVGKTTLVRTIMGLCRPTSGQICFQDQDVTAKSAYQRARLGMGYAPQGRHIFPRLTVEENLQTGLPRGQSAVPESVFDYFPVLGDMKSRFGGDLSGGQQQQLSIARALVTDPEFLILDEPTEGIQPNIIQRIGEVLNRLSAEEGKTILIVEQYLAFVKTFCDRFVLMNRGRVVAADTIDGLTDGLVSDYLHV